ncbi:hypothetical protein GON03_21875 [Nocardioides sp. MAH-18]|uniref:Secreted protein n=1 Tax=Nocardioides agri TaxID=2682843 RepID=A0A6L6XYV0_9ACTN|nr:MULTISPECIES: hypothetical protein [unclassified Nocardioides]MBA2952675.1 hypothetical protein [Nocardioides sp. CGMCC 1.13656]MVQ51837.1 hypothetical protein [Nocardioides sp. MAH-18]
MRSQLLTGALAVAATSALVGLGAGTASAQSPDPMTEGTSHERGTLIECTGTVGDTPVRANIYQNRTFGNFLELLVADGTPDEAGASLEKKKPFVTGTKVRAAAKVGGHRLTITGTAKPTGETEHIREVIPNDGGLRIVTTGTHLLLAPVLTATYDGETGALTCDNAFRFRLKVTKTSIVD